MKLSSSFSRLAKCTVLALALPIVPAFGQFSIHLGPQVGAYYTKIKSNYTTFDGGISPYVGLAAEGRISRGFGIEIGEGFMMINSNRSGRDSATYYDRKIFTEFNTKEKFTFINSQVLFKFHIPLGGIPIIPYDRADRNQSSITLFAGPNINYLLSYDPTGTLSKYTVLNNTGDTTDRVGVRPDLAYTDATGQIIDPDTYVNKLTYGVTLGAGLDLALTERFDFVFDVRFNQLLTSLDYGIFGQTNFDIASGKLLYTYDNMKYSQIGGTVGVRYRIAGRNPEWRRK